MKNKIFMAVAVAAIFTACNSDNLSESDATGTVAQVTFNVQGDFTLTTSPMTRALTADGRDMTDVWVFDYQGATLKQQIHQTSEDDDFGTPTITLDYGDHHLYFVAARSTNPTINTTDKTMTFAKVYDTFWKDYSISIDGNSNGNRAVTLERVVTKMRLTFTDPVPDGTATINVTPGTWYYGFNYQTGEPAASATNQLVTIAIPSSTYGPTNQSANIYGFSSETQWTTDISFNSLDADNKVIGQASITGAPFVRNRVTEYSGTFWTAGGGMTLSLNADWDTSYTGTW